MTMMYTSKVGIETIEKVIALSDAAFTANMGIDEVIIFGIENISRSSTTLNDMVIEPEMDSVMLTSASIEGKS